MAVAEERLDNVVINQHTRQLREISHDPRWIGREVLVSDQCGRHVNCRKREAG
jgi:hypothetical protein